MKLTKRDCLEIVKEAYREVGEESGTGFVYIVRGENNYPKLCRSVSEALGEMKGEEIISLAYIDFEESSIATITQTVYKKLIQKEIKKEIKKVLSRVYSGASGKITNKDYVTLRPNLDRRVFEIDNESRLDRHTEYDVVVYNPAIVEQDCEVLMRLLMESYLRADRY